MQPPMPPSPTTISVSDAFDGGNIELVSITDHKVSLHIKPDPYTELEQKHHLQARTSPRCEHTCDGALNPLNVPAQWFYFRSLVGTQGDAVVAYEITNAGAVSFPDAWPSSSVMYSTDRKSWKRIWSTSYEGGSLNPSHVRARPRLDDPPPCSLARGRSPHGLCAADDCHLERVLECQTAGARVRSLGKTLDGRELDCISVGRGRLQAWVIARQHPGEPQAEHYAFGLLERLLGLDSNGRVDGLVRRAQRDSLARDGRARARAHVARGPGPQRR
eukprot:246186-Prymnesium_polylepis.2